MQLLLSFSGVVAFFSYIILVNVTILYFLDCDQAITTKFDKGRAERTVTTSARGGLPGVFLQRHQVPSYLRIYDVIHHTYSEIPPMTLII